MVYLREGPGPGGGELAELGRAGPESARRRKIPIGRGRHLPRLARCDSRPREMRWESARLCDIRIGRGWHLPRGWPPSRPFGYRGRAAD